MLFSTNDKIVCREHYKESTKKKNHPRTDKSEFSQMIGYKINIQNKSYFYVLSMNM